MRIWVEGVMLGAKRKRKNRVLEVFSQHHHHQTPCSSSMEAFRERMDDGGERGGEVLTKK